ncbi:Ferritin-like metal-binding protein YciE [Haladaptatus litoreus]|uniref:Ferritin-like metal-binding protein YciE n=1 Tax=Haladaptatus litoreus TaxID=553468 RepID=A0A1N7DZJ1_9EURY|nr:DUF892 family protein [Haladaptatus litoreus]SIR81206.1 Ferritin-like metal-binding protein YciE [Haladaptatus litoreus]
MQVNSLHDLFVYELQEMYDIENKLVGALNDLATETSNEDISRAFAEHREETENHVSRVEEAFNALNEIPERQDNDVVDGLINEHDKFESIATNEDVRDMFALNAGMKSERLEITGYEGLLMLADQLDFGSDVTDPLESNMSDEKDALSDLQDLAGGSKLKSLVSRLTG